MISTDVWIQDVYFSTDQDWWSSLSSSKEKPVLKLFLMKMKLNFWEAKLFGIPLVHISDKIIELRQLSNITSWSSVNQNFLVELHLLSALPLRFSSAQSEWFFCCLLAKLKYVIKNTKNQKNKMRSKWSLIRTNCAQNLFWSN